MAVIIDLLVTFGVLGGFGFLIWARLVAKYPKLKEMFESKKEKIKDISPMDFERRQQIWTENRSMM